MAICRLIVETSRARAERVSEALFAAGAEGLEERAGRPATLVTYAASRGELEQLWGRAQVLLAASGPGPLPRARIEVDRVEAWRDEWTRHLRPVALTRRFVIAPLAHADCPLGPGQERLLYEPALAFGDGGHVTTRLASRAVEAHCRRQAGARVLDIGAGSGVLSIIAAKSGARRVVGTDVDPVAVQAARRNAELNGVSACTRFIEAHERLTGEFDLVVVNVELRPLLEILSALPRAARRAPRLLATGFLDGQAAAVRSALGALGFTRQRRSRALPHEREAAQAPTEAGRDWLLIDARPPLASALANANGRRGRM